MKLSEPLAQLVEQLTLNQQFCEILNKQVKLRPILICLDQSISHQINSLGGFSHFPIGGESDVSSKIISTHINNKGGGSHEDPGGYR